MTRYLDLLHRIEVEMRQYGSDKNDEKGLVGFVSTPNAEKGAMFSNVSTERIGKTETVPLFANPTETTTNRSYDESSSMRAREPLSPNEETAIRRTLDAIGETNPTEIDEVVKQCGSDPQARLYWLKRAVFLTERKMQKNVGRA